jgi:capsular exopolysaccharide synthesis family protein
MQDLRKIVTLQDILHFFSRYIKYWKLAVVGAVLGIVLALAYFVYGKPSYYSKSVVEWSYVDLPLKSEISDVRGNTKWDKIFYQVVGGLQSRWLAERTAIRLGLVKDVSELGTIWTRFISKVRITPTVSDHLEIEVWVYEPRLAKLWPEAMLLEYHDYLTESRIKYRDKLIAGFTREMDRIQENLKTEAERDRQFESENRILENYVANNNLEQLPTQMLTYRTQLDAMEEMGRFIENTAPTSAEKLALMQKYRSAPLPIGTIVRRGESPDPFMVKSAQPNVVSGATGDLEASADRGTGASKNSPTVIVTPEQSRKTEGWESIQTDLQEALNEQQRLSATLLPGHEKMRELRKQIDALNFALDSEWESAKQSFELEKLHLKQRLEDLQESMPEYRKLIAGYDDYRRDFRLQSGGRLAWEQAYMGMKSRLTAMDYTGPEVQVDFNLLGFTDVRDDVPVSPNKQKLMTYALALSLGLGLGGPILTERLRFTSSFVAEAEKYCQYPACGIVPLMEVADCSIGAYIGDQKASRMRLTHANESFRIIRNVLPFYATKSAAVQVIMITSARPNDGKSTIAEHLARSFAESGERTLLIDADLRRGALHREFGSGEERWGLMEVLSKKREFVEVVEETGITNLMFLPRGLSANRDYDVLAGSGLSDVIEMLRGNYDKIILDTPPVLGVADCLVITRVVDGVLFVIRSDQTTQRDIVTAAETLRQSGVGVYGFVLNGVDFSRAENNYYYGSYYSRYYEPRYYTTGHRIDSKPTDLN